MNDSSPISVSARLRQHLRVSTAASWRRTGSSGSPPTARRRWSVLSHRLVGCAVLGLTVLCGYTASQRAAAKDEPRVIIREAANRYGVPEDLIAAVIEAESDFNPRAV